MGHLLRWYWHPIAPIAELDGNPLRTKEIRLLGEDLVLFRDRRGGWGLIGRYCSHRRMNLALGMVEEDGIRCPYHGWKFAADGTCVDQPFETTVRSDGHYAQRCGVPGYPVQELAGLVWAYLGPAPAPLLPRWAPLVWDEAVRDIAIAELPCNWLQCQENSLDPVHTEWLHGNYPDYLRRSAGMDERTGCDKLGPAAGRKHLRIRFYEFEHGMAGAWMVEGDIGTTESWTIGQPALFPHIFVTGCRFAYTMQYRVPMDDTHTSDVSIHVYPAAPGALAPPQCVVPYRYVPLKDEFGNWTVDSSSNRNYMTWVEQGPVAARDREKLGHSDVGVVKYRALLQAQLRRLDYGLAPMNVFRDPTVNVCIDFPRPQLEHGTPTRPAYQPGMSNLAEDHGRSSDTVLIEKTLATWDTVSEDARPTRSVEAASNRRDQSGVLE
ncbi:Rieske 2Fe-2S domain-containing protein [Nocardia brasiliensis]